MSAKERVRSFKKAKNAKVVMEKKLILLKRLYKYL
jgi:hypothetical protein